MCFAGSWVRDSGSLIVVVSGGNRTWARSQAVSAPPGDSRAPQPGSLRSRDHRGMVSIWIMRGLDAEGGEVVVVKL